LPFRIPANLSVRGGDWAKMSFFAYLSLFSRLFLNNLLKNRPSHNRNAGKFLLLVALAFCFSFPVFAQNTKGDKPTNQTPFLRFPKKKSRHKGGDRAYTGDISGRRRIRTKNESSANRAIYRAPDPYAGRAKPGRNTDHVGKPMGRIYNTPPKERQRAWKGTLSSAPLRVRSISARRARHNIYPQFGPYINHRSTKPNQQVYRRTVGGWGFLNKPPNLRQRAWLGGGGPGSASGSYVTYGRKNVYWGKFSKGEKPITKDLTGRALRTRNFHSAAIGGIASDTAKVARRKAGKGSVSGQARGGFVTASKRGERAWSGDISGRTIRRRNAVTGESTGISVLGFRRSPSARARNNTPLPPRQPGVGASGIARMLKKLTGGKAPSRTRGKAGGLWNNGNRPIDVRAPGIGASGMGRYRGKLKFGDLSPGFGHGGAGYSGTMRQQRPLVGGGSASGRFLNNHGRPIPRLQPGLGAAGITTFRGDFRRGRPLKGGGSVSGRYLNNKGQPVNVRVPGIGSLGIGRFQGKIRGGDQWSTFSHEGAGYAGNIKARRRLVGGGSVSGRYLNNNGQPVDVRIPGIGSQGIARYQGKIRRGDQWSTFSHEGAGYAGNIKARRRPVGGGSVSGRYLNNNGRPVDVRVPGIGAQGIGRYRGNIRRGDLWSEFSHEGAGYSGNIRARRLPKGGGSVTAKIWNNPTGPLPARGGAPGFDRASRYRGDIPQYEAVRTFGQQGYGFSGNIKARKPKKGGGSISGRFLNNDGKAVDVRPPGNETARASGFSGNLKGKRQEKGGGSISGKVWNNNEKPLDPRAPSSGQANGASYSGMQRLSRFKRDYVQNPKASDLSIKKKKPDGRIYAIDGLTTKERQEKYSRKPHATGNALLGIGPKEGSVRASEYASAMKMYWSYKHNPSSNARALMVVAPGKAYARINDYQGNLRMKKYNGNRMHPDAQFAHGFRDNTKNDRTLMMNIKLLWAKWFKKNDTQPAIVKEKAHKPRYDRKEKELWKALYD